jgi:hypothetical protein
MWLPRQVVVTSKLKFEIRMHSDRFTMMRRQLLGVALSCGNGLGVTFGIFVTLVAHQH